jgi:hypothetical protein
MNSEDFIKLTDHMHKEEKDEYRMKNADYADREGKNILANFERVSKHLNITPQMALMVYMEKHMDAIRSYIRYGSVMSEPIEGRIKDARGPWWNRKKLSKGTIRFWRLPDETWDGFERQNLKTGLTVQSILQKQYLIRRKQHEQSISNRKSWCRSGKLLHQ